MRSSTFPAARAVEHTYVPTKTFDLQADSLKFYVAIFQNASKKGRPGRLSYHTLARLHGSSTRHPRLSQFLPRRRYRA